MTIVDSKPVRSARKAKGDGHLRRAEILEAAERIFIAQGYEGATIRKIADEVGVSSTALYMHFRDKDEILLEICTSTMLRLHTSNSEISARKIDPAVRVKLMLEAYTRFALEHPNAYRLVYCSPAMSSPDFRHSAASEIGSATYKIFADAVRQIAADGRLRMGDSEAAAQALWAACHGLVSLLITKPDFNWAPHDELIHVTIDGLLAGLVED